MYNRIKQALVGSIIGLGIISNTVSAFADDTYYTLDNVNLRNQATTESDVLTLVELGNAVTVTEHDADGWSKVVYNDKEGFMKSEFLGTQGQALAGTYYSIDNVNLRSNASTDSEVMQLVKFGTAVTVTEYNPDGWSKVTYDDKEGFMKSEYLGTQKQLEKAKESAKPVVELTQWSDAKHIFTIGVSAKVFDVYTGITYNVKSFSNGSHADVEPVTSNDTNLMKKTFGGVWSWDVRPIWVTINGKTMAASINGMPHGGGVNSNNGMEGQVCIHFKGSKTHNGNSSYTKLHQNKAQEAYNIANK